MDAIVSGDLTEKRGGPWALPEGWCWTRTSDLPMGGGGSVEPSKTPDTPFVLYSVPAFENKAPDLVLGREIESNKQYVPPDALLVCKINPRINRVWRVKAHVPDQGAVIASTEWIVIRPSSTVDPDFLRYFFSTERVRQYLAANVSGVGGSLMRVNATTIGEIKIPLAPLAEQKRIVARVDALFAEIAEGEAALAETRKGLDTFRRALLKAAVTGELTKDWRMKNPVAETGHDRLARIRAERAECAPAKGRGRCAAEVARASALTDLPEGWAVGNLGEISLLITDGDHNPPKRLAQGIPHITAKNVKFGRVSLSGCSYVSEEGYEQTSQRYKPAIGDILITCVGTLGKIAIFRERGRISVDRNIAAVRLVGSILPEFVELVLNSPLIAAQLKTASGSTAQPHLYLKDIRRLEMPIPPPAEAVEMLRRVAEALSAKDDTRALLDAEAANVARLKQSILKAAFEGRLVPQDPSDEPAGSALARAIQDSPHKLRGNSTKQRKAHKR